MTDTELSIVASNDDILWPVGGAIPTALICSNALRSIGLRQLLAGTCFKVVSTSFQETLPSESSPALIIVDAHHDLHETTDTIRTLKSRYLDVRIVVMADQLERSVAAEVYIAGADGCFLTSSSRAVLIKSLEMVMLGQTVLPSTTIVSMLDEMTYRSEPPFSSTEPVQESKPRDPGSYRLSERETEVLGCLAQGVSNKIIAHRLDVAEATVKVHVKAILRKIGVTNRTQAAIWATGHLPTSIGTSQRTRQKAW